MPRGVKPTTRRSPTQGGKELRARVSAEEYARVKAAADADGLTVPAHVRRMALGGRYRDVLLGVMAAAEPVELERPLVVAEVAERSCFTCRYDYCDTARAFHFCRYDPIEDALDYMADSGAETSPDGLPTDRAMRCPGWAAKETT